MGLPLVALAPKLNLLAAVGGGGVSHCLSPMVAGLAWPFLVLKVSFSLKPIKRAYKDVLYASRLFFFQLGRIALSPHAAAATGDHHRWERAVRLVCQRIVRQSTASETDEESFRNLSMLAL